MEKKFGVDNEFKTPCNILQEKTVNKRKSYSKSAR